MLGVNEPLCVEIYVCQCWHKKRMLGTCVFAERLKGRCEQIYVQLYCRASTPASFSTASPSFLEKGAYLAVIYWKMVVGVVAPFSWSFPGYLLFLLLISPRSCSVPNVGFLVRAFFNVGWLLSVLLATVRGIEPQALCVMGKHLTTELHPQPLVRVVLAALAFRCTFAVVWSGELVENWCQGGSWHDGGGNGRGGGGDKKS